jgi:hypothetical protein
MNIGIEMLLCDGFSDEEFHEVLSKLMTYARAKDCKELVSV